MALSVADAKQGVSVNKVEIHSTSKHSAICSDIPLRSGERIQLVFRPEIVDNPTNPGACVKGRFLYQKKARTRSGSISTLSLCLH